MENVKLSQIKVAQALHGYRDGHKLLASSISLDDYADIEMARMSDLMPQSLAGASTYLCGYPLKSIKKYVVSKTWSAPEMSRPGCVWTHSLLLDYSLVAKLSTLASLLGYFVRPNVGDYVVYSEELNLLEENQGNFGAEDFSDATQAAGRETEYLRRALLSVYFQKQNKIFLPSLLGSFENDAVAVLLWNQMPPRLRRDFVFCTAGTARSLTPPAEVTLIITDECLSGSQSALSDEEAEGALKALLQDVIAPGKTELRSFISRYVTDALDARYAVVKLAMVAQLLFAGDTRRGLQDAARATVQNFPTDGDCGLMKRELLLGTLLDSKRFDQRERFELVLSNVLPALKFLKNYTDTDAIDNFILQAITASASGIPAVINACHGAPRDSLGYELLRSLCHQIPIDKLAAISLSAEAKLMLASFEGKMLEMEQFWRTFESEPTSSDWETLNSIGNLEVLAAGFLEGGMYAPVRVWVNENPDMFVPAIIRFMRSKDKEVRHDVLREFRGMRSEFIEHLACGGGDCIEILDSIAKDIFYSPYPEVGPESWVRLFQGNRDAVEQISPHIAFVLFEQAGRTNKRNEAVYLYQLSFEVLHSLDLMSGEDSRLVSEKIQNTYSADYSSGQSDTGNRVRRKLCNFFEDSHQYDEFFKCVHNDEILGQLFLSMSRLWRGKEWLQGLLYAIEHGRVHVTNHQKLLLITALPPNKKKKGFFDFW